MKNFKITLLNILITSIVAFILFYLFLPSINITNIGFWFYVIIILLLYGFLNSFKGILNITKNTKAFFDIKKTIPFAISAIVVLLIVRLFGDWFKKAVKVQAKVIDNYMSERTVYDMVYRRGMRTDQIYTVCFDINGYVRKFNVSPLAYDYLQKEMRGTLTYKDRTYIDFDEN